MWPPIKGLTRRGLLGAAAAAAGAARFPALAAGPVAPDWQSLAAAYRVPDWYRDAKFGIWAHWGPQCVPEAGDWYGRLMYVQGHPAYDHHLRTYGHPSRTGFLDIIGRWKAEAWEPERLIALYRKAGARYFMSMANHHDNFDNFDSAHHGWNSVRVGPKRDIVGTWAKAARAAGLRFGISNHSSHAWHWWQTAYGYDAEGPMRGARYDAFRLRRRDGRGTWWEGLDPQDLYTGPAFVPPAGIDGIKAMNAWHDARDGQWHEELPVQNPGFARNWLLRQKDLVEKYRPDLVYLDDSRLPFGRLGLEAAAHFYNNSLAHQGAIDVVLTAKQLSPYQLHGIVEDVERGFVDGIRPQPWQTDTCIGNWHYDRGLYERHGYKSAKLVVQRLCDVVSKNGNLLLSIPVRGSGAIDEDEEQILADLARWFAANGEAIYGTRPWRVYGEGPTRPKSGFMNESEAPPFTSADIRFTAKDGVLNAALLDWPEGKVVISSLSTNAMPDARVERVELLGHGPVEWLRDVDAMHVALPRPRDGAFVPVLRIHGRGIA
ncbi:MAG: alpha-L-fucosidase [Alphaproteobacteria bacterium]|nr:alpha-L-fucosidase [Alphaproteobacteria bacterium]